MITDATVYVIDDDQALTESLAWMLDSVGLNAKTFNNAQGFIEAYDPQSTACLVLDVRLPQTSGPELQEQLNRQGINLPIIFITGHADVPMAVRTLKAGAIDFLPKPFNDQVLLESINKALRIDQEKRGKVIKKQEAKNLIHQLTKRENEIMQQIVAGKLNKIISSDLNISLKTVETHRANIMKKLEVKSVTSLIKLAMDYELQT